MWGHPVSSNTLYLAIEGPIGVGKTTLAERLTARLNARRVLEVVEENPFLADFYTDRDRYAFQTQLFFLMSRFKQQQQLLQPDLFRPNILADYHLLKDRIFARLTLQDQELALYERVYRSLESQILKPDVVIYLHAPLPVLLERIQRRGREFERDFDAGYLSDLARAYQEFFAHYDDTPLLRLDNSELNYADDTPEAHAVVDDILQQLIALAERGRRREPGEASP
ncbi:MAG: deoxynucleoside kinase [Deltaproteobacteria bacterium]|nr:deoxynucleoside kinase [Deltaproteobacteria bacterium]MCB9786761.1 deoxynucleoside kinase [Deltaproteobacteria bacterium]